MASIAAFGEDFAHQEFLDELVKKIAGWLDVKVAVEWRNARRGHGAVLRELRQYVRDILEGTERMPDLLLVASDANCDGHARRKNALLRAVRALPAPAVFAVPDPHIERWYLIEQAAFRAVFGRGCQAPDRKCERRRYKKLLLEAIVEAGVQPNLGGIEFARDLVAAMDVERACRQDRSFAAFVEELTRALRSLPSGNRGA